MSEMSRLTRVSLTLGIVASVATVIGTGAQFLGGTRSAPDMPAAPVNTGAGVTLPISTEIAPIRDAAVAAEPTGTEAAAAPAAPQAAAVQALPPPAPVVSVPVWTPEVGLRITENAPSPVCADRIFLRFTVAKAGTRPDAAIYLDPSLGGRKVTVGETFPLSQSCRLRLDRTGKTAVFFAEFTFQSQEG